MIWTNWIATILLWNIICWIVSLACDWILGAQHMGGTLRHNVSHINHTQIQPNAIVNVFICICKQLRSTCALWGTRHVKCIAGRKQMWTGDLLLNLKNYKTKNKPWISQSNTKWLDISFMISRSLKLPFKTHFRDKILALEKKPQNRTNGCTIPLDNGPDILGSWDAGSGSRRHFPSKCVICTTPAHKI